MSENNKVVRNGNRITKTFGNHMDYVKELSVYNKLKGTDLCARITDDSGDCIEHEYIDGVSLLDLFNAPGADLEKKADLLELFFIWYKSFREKVKLNLGKPSFAKFILAENKLICIDFEHCRPGYMEEDIEMLSNELLEISPGLAERFRKMSVKYFDLDNEILERLEKQK